MNGDDIKRMQSERLKVQIDDEFKRMTQEILDKATKNNSLNFIEFSCDKLMTNSLVEKFRNAKYCAFTLQCGWCNCNEYMSAGNCSCGGLGQDEGFPCANDCEIWRKEQPHATNCSSHKYDMLCVSWK